MQRRFLFLATLLSIACAPVVRAQIIINEIHYAPANKTIPEEFLELYNAGPTDVEVSGWYFSDGLEFTMPADTWIQAGAYLVVAADPTRLRAIYGDFPVVGPFSGRLGNESDEIVLRNTAGQVEDRVDYRRGFPWPTVGGSENYSMELVHPGFDNDLGGSWRISNPGIVADTNTLVAAGERWSYFKGESEASNPRDAWRVTGFNDSSWSSGNLPVGYGEGFIRTQLADMRDNYTSYFLRKTFTVADPSAIGSLVLEVQYDDGFNAWINGRHVAGANVSSNDLPYDGVAGSSRENLDFETFQLPRPVNYLQTGENVLCVQVHNHDISSSSDAFIDVKLARSSSAAAGPTPGFQNSVFDVNAPPHLRQVEHFPHYPFPSQPVRVTVKATDDDGVAAVTLSYRTVEPGSYVELGDAAYEQGWVSVPMVDDGTDGDEVPFDGVYTTILSGNMNSHRRLVRYRISAEDTTGLVTNAPYPDDPQPNFAYFVYGGVPQWSGAIEPGSTNQSRAQVTDYSREVMNSVQTYHLLTKRASTEDCTWFSKYGGDNYLWRGTLVADDGTVYDHINYRARGGVWRYAMGKNMWKFDFLRGHSFQARDDYGREYRTKWDKLNFSAIIQQGDYLHRGEQGLFESTGFKMFNLMGLESCRTHYVQFRIVDELSETGNDQYDGDAWGLYLVLEQMDGRFLDEHDLPDGNLYKMEGGTGDLNNQGPTAATNKSDLNEFLNTYQSGNPPESWWRDNLDLERYYGYRSVLEAIHHYDNAYGKNYFYYLDPVRDVWIVLAWDLDLTWADNMFGSGDEPFKSRVLAKPSFNIDYESRMRECRDLLYNADQMGQMIEEFGAMVNDPGGAPSLVDFDRRRWDYNPIMTNGSIVNTGKAGRGRFYERGTTRTFEGMMQTMKNYVNSRGSWIDSTITNDSSIPRQPTVTYIGGNGFPIDQLAFRTSSFSDPNGNGSFAAVAWRMAEVEAPGAPPFDPRRPRHYEIVPTWESGEITTQRTEIVVPSGVTKIGSRYRVRARYQDTTGRWGNWSSPVEFTASAPTVPFPQQGALRVTELMYHPTDGSDAEFIEVQNVSDQTVDLSYVSFTDGIEFNFADGDVRELGPGEFVVVVENLVAFSSAYDTADMNVAGQYRGRFDNAGERIELTFGGNSVIQAFTYVDTWYGLTDGGGYSLNIIDPFDSLDAWSSEAGWKESSESGGTPGREDGSGPIGGRQLPGDSNQDSVLDISDVVSLLRRLFVDGALTLPCEGAIGDDANRALLDLNDDSSVNVSDAIYTLEYLFKSGPAPVAGETCIRIVGCPSACR